jgi:hypothetical protein
VGLVVPTVTEHCTSSPEVATKVFLQRTGNYVGAYDESGLLLAQLRIA